MIEIKIVLRKEVIMVKNISKCIKESIKNSLWEVVYYPDFFYKKTKDYKVYFIRLIHYDEKSPLFLKPVNIQGIVFIFNKIEKEIIMEELEPKSLSHYKFIIIDTPQTNIPIKGNIIKLNTFFLPFKDRSQILSNYILKGLSFI